MLVLARLLSKLLSVFLFLHISFLIINSFLFGLSFIFLSFETLSFFSLLDLLLEDVFEFQALDNRHDPIDLFLGFSLGGFTFDELVLRVGKGVRSVLQVSLCD